MLRRLPLASKTLLRFGVALGVVLLAVVVAAWFRLSQVVDDGEHGVSRQMVLVWEAAARRSADALTPTTLQPVSPQPTVPGAPGGPGEAFPPATRVGGLQTGVRLFFAEAKLDVLSIAQVEAMPQRPAFVERALREIRAANAAATASSSEPTNVNPSDPSVAPQPNGASESLPVSAHHAAPIVEVFVAAWDFTSRQYRYAKGVRGADGLYEGVILLERTSASASNAMFSSGLQLGAFGAAALVLSLGALYWVMRRLYLRPMERLRDTADAAREGDLQVRSDLATGDEFEDMGSALNAMLTNIQIQQDQLRAINASLDGKLTELVERNVALYESARLKGEFLANVTHELRTPLNSVLGFAELLDEAAERDAQTAPPTDDGARLTKRRRYIENILNAGRTLLDLINGLLEMAKVEAGKMEVQIGEIRLRSACEHLLALMRPLADKRQVELVLECPDELPPMLTDARKLQQVIFNFMANAVKFSADAADAERDAWRTFEALRTASEASADPTGAGEIGGETGGDDATVAPWASVPESERVKLPQAPRAPRQPRVTLRVELLNPLPESGPDSVSRVRLSVLDNGPGIAKEDQERIFEKFTQLDTGYARRHAGTGLGLAICKTLTLVLQGELHVHSELGRGSMFSVILPLRFDLAPERRADAKAEARQDPVPARA
jgi:signal transduction histidine kinase